MVTSKQIVTRFIRFRNESKADFMLQKMEICLEFVTKISSLILAAAKVPEREQLPHKAIHNV